MTSSKSFPQLMIFMAVFLQAIGKIAYGTWLGDVPSSLFVFVSFAITAAFFLLVSRGRPGDRAWGLLVMLNLATALTFLCFFYALRIIEPAIVGAVEIGIGPVIAVLVALAVVGEKPTVARLCVCTMILIGCLVLARAAISGAGLEGVGGSAWMGLLASAAAGVGAVFITIFSKSLMKKNWSFGAILAHRFYVIVPLALLFWTGSPQPEVPITWSSHLVMIVLGVTVVGVLAPLYLLQLGIEKCDPYTVMVTMAALPVITYVLEGFSPAYVWSVETLVGLAIITAALMTEIFMPRLRGMWVNRAAVR